MTVKIARRPLLWSAAGLVAGAQVGSADARKPVKLPSAFENLDHERFMRLAIEQASKVPACPFGAVVVNAKSANRVCG
jgi:hypothetical protein